MAEIWKVFRCSACGMCHGRKSTGHKCPHCGQRINDSTPVVDKAQNPSELRRKVLLSNTPPELRESLAKRLSESESLINSKASYTPARGLAEVRKLVDSEGKVSINEIIEVFKIKGFADSVEEFLETAEAQGALVRLGIGMWRFLE